MMSVLVGHKEHGQLLYMQDLGELQDEKLAGDGTAPVMTCSFALHATWLWYEHIVACHMVMVTV